MFRTNLSGDNDLPLEIDYTKLFDTVNTIDKNKIKIPTEKKQPIQVYNGPVVEELSDCNSGKWQLGLVASCLAIYFGLPYLFGHK